MNSNQYAGLYRRVIGLRRYAESSHREGMTKTLLEVELLLEKLSEKPAEDSLRHQYIRSTLQGMLACQPSFREFTTPLVSGSVVEIADAVMAAAEKEPVRSRLSPPAEAISWLEWQRFADIPQIHDALKDFSEDSTGDNGVHLVRAIITKALEIGL